MQETFAAGGRSIRVEMVEPAPRSSVPSSRAEEELHPAVIILHGSGGNSGFWMDHLAPHATEAGIALYAPHYFDRTGTGRAEYTAIADGVHVPQWLDTVDAALRWVACRPGVDPTRIAIVGVSLGAFLSLGLAAQLSASPEPRERERMRCLIEVSGGLVEPYASQATPAFPPTLLLHGDADTVVPVAQARALDERLTALAVGHTTRLLPGEGHWFSTAAQMTLLLAAANFLQQHLALQLAATR